MVLIFFWRGRCCSFISLDKNTKENPPEKVSKRFSMWLIFSTISVDIICLADIHYLECSLHLASFSMTAKYSSPIWSIYGIYYIYTLRIQVNHEINSRLGEVRPWFFVGIYFINNFKGTIFLNGRLDFQGKKNFRFHQFLA